MFNFNFSAKIKEAEEHIKQGEKYLKTSLTKWKPDLDSAIEEFDKACTCYRVAEKYDLCRDLSIRLADLQIQKGSTFFAAKSYEQAAQMTQQLQDLPTAAKYFNKAGELYVEGGQRDSGTLLYERYAPQFQQFDRGLTIDFYLKAAHLAEQDDKTSQAIELYEKAAMQVIRTGNFPKTTELLELVTKHLTYLERFDHLNRIILYRILLKLFNEDSVAGRNIFDQACRDYPTFEQWEERDHIELLLDGFDLEDKDLISKRCQKPYFMTVEPEFVRLMKRWIVPVTDKKDEQQNVGSSSTSGVKPMQLDGDEVDLLANPVTSQVDLSCHSIPLTNVSRSGNQVKFEEKESSASTSQTSSLLMPLKVSWKNDNFIPDESIQDNTNQHDYAECLRLGSFLIDRPFGNGLQPFDMMGPVLMKFNMCEQHWITPDGE
ncbi:unnamed protein product [Rotaria magnacalcarata]|uniref:Gamma-soluble NSF attachment protein n=1 Tax=Rotaria magnacalcarata TaxID=392030 RepID=A0A819N463_9BILA|nr:unnamed protein product [Rotaria magnacalcarata]CAF3956243.1 unnamed protein product [Rotaria magnacalcarata]CAF3989751.1 unnamed protein product [Rotaria magnacalcarata]